MIIKCNRHGDREDAFVCSHLLDGEGLGFHFDVHSSSPHPDAWCTQCDRVRIENGGEWNDRSETLIDVRLVCADCYEEAKLKNLRLSGYQNASIEAKKIMTDEEYLEFCHVAQHELLEKNAVCEQQFLIGHREQWQYDADQGTLTFSAEGVAKVIANVQVVGTTSIKSNTWLWGWANESVPTGQTTQIQKVRLFGEAESLSVLTEASWPDDEYHGWEMTAITAKIINAKGGYRAPRQGGGFSYYVYTAVRLVDQVGSRLT